MTENENPPDDGVPQAEQKPVLERRELIKNLAKSALLPALVVAFVAAETTDAAAS